MPFVPRDWTLNKSRAGEARKGCPLPIDEGVLPGHPIWAKDLGVQKGFVMGQADSGSHSRSLSSGTSS